MDGRSTGTASASARGDSRLLTELPSLPSTVGGGSSTDAVDAADAVEMHDADACSMVTDSGVSSDAASPKSADADVLMMLSIEGFDAFFCGAGLGANFELVYFEAPWLDEPEDASGETAEPLSSR